MRRDGFTLVELLAALLLTAGLSVALLGVIGGSVQTLRGTDASHTSHTGALALLTHDAEHATRIEAATGDTPVNTPVNAPAIELTTACGLDPGTGTVVLRPATVRYTLHSDGRLLRHQAYVDEPTEAYDAWVLDGVAGLVMGEARLGDRKEEVKESESEDVASGTTLIELRRLDGSVTRREVWR